MTPEGVVVLLHVEIQEREIHLERDPFDPPRVLLHDRLRPTVPRERGKLGEERPREADRISLHPIIHGRRDRFVRGLEGLDDALDHLGSHEGLVAEENQGRLRVGLDHLKPDPDRAGHAGRVVRIQNGPHGKIGDLSRHTLGLVAQDDHGLHHTGGQGGLDNPQDDAPPPEAQEELGAAQTA